MCLYAAVNQEKMLLNFELPDRLTYITCQTRQVYSCSGSFTSGSVILLTHLRNFLDLHGNIIACATLFR
jgi:hypothetical protein